jgi:hypothetical protein
MKILGEVMVKFHQEPVLYRRYDMPEMLFQRPVEYPTAITPKSLAGWSHLLDHLKAERVVFQNGIQNPRSFGQSKTGN